MRRLPPANEREGDMGGRRTGRVLGLALLVSMAVAGAAGAAPRPYGDVRVVAQVPVPPGFPEGVAVAGNLVWVSGPATFGTIGLPPSKVLVFHAGSGTLVRSWDIVGEDISQEHANSSIALDRLQRAYVLNTQLGVVRISLNGKQELYSGPFPDLPMCAAVPSGTPCSPTPFDAPALPNDLVFAANGDLYVTDSLQATIWRVPAGGGAPEIWFQDPRLASPSFGPNGIRIDPSGTTLYFTVSEDFEGRAFVYTLPLIANPTAGDLEVFHEYTGGDLPDGIAFGSTGLLYVAIATPFASGISILDPDGTEVDRLVNEGNPVFPYDSPANIAFDGRGSIMVTNHAFVTGISDPEQFTVIDVYVADKGLPLNRPIFV
jgi:sugar lactone lactonase YvrE